MFPLRAAVRKGIFELIGHHEVARPNKPFPTFRDGFADPKTKKVAVWWLWDGESEWKVGARLLLNKENCRSDLFGMMQCLFYELRRDGALKQILSEPI